MMELLTSYNEQVCVVIWDNALQMLDTYHIKFKMKFCMSSLEMFSFHHNIGDAKFCLIFDETWNESRRKQMTLVIKFVDKSEFIRECFFLTYYMLKIQMI
jgi:hypothetical protein